MACIPCAALLLAADSIDVGRLVKDARAVKGQPLAFCDACKGGEHAADGDGFGLTPSEVVATLGADAPAASIAWALIFNPADGSITYQVQQGIVSAQGAIPAGTSNPGVFLAGQLAAARIALPAGVQIPIPTADNPAAVGSSAGASAPGGFVGGWNCEPCRKVRIAILAALIIGAIVYLWKER